MLHRQTVPTYFGGLPASTHDYINDPVTNGDTGPASPVDAGKHATTGSYFIVLNEPATSANTNRPAFALSENTDFIDDILHTSRPILAYEDFVSAGESKIQLTGDVFVGRSGVSPINQEERDFLIAIVDPTTMQQLVVDLGTPMAAICNNLYDSADSGNVIGTEASGYHTNPWVYLGVVMPVATAYRVIYLRRATVAAESDPDDVTGDMGYLAGYLVKSLRRGAAVESFYTPTYGGWHDGTRLSASNANDAIDEITLSLADDSTGTAGAEKIGAESYSGNGTFLSTGSVESQLQELADECGGLATANTWTAVNTFSSGITLSTVSPFYIDATGPSISGFLLSSGGIFRVREGTNNLLELNDTSSELSSNLNTWKIGDDTNDDRSFEIPAVSSTGVQAGGTWRFKAQDGQQQTGGNPNNDGGSLMVEVGYPGTGGAGGESGSWIRRYRTLPGDEPTDVETYHRRILAVAAGGTATFDLPVRQDELAIVKVTAAFRQTSAGAGIAALYAVHACNNIGGTISMVDTPTNIHAESVPAGAPALDLNDAGGGYVGVEITAPSSFISDMVATIEITKHKF